MDDELKILGIYVSNDNNLMYMVYNKKYAIAFDTTDPEVLKYTLTIEPPMTMMKKKDVYQCEQKRKIILLAVFITHHYWDHSSGKNKTIELLSNYVNYFEDVIEEKVYKFENFEVQSIKTPCHTLDSHCFLVDKFLITGDTVLFLGCGKIFEGNADKMKEYFEKLRKYIKSDVLGCYGHDYSDIGYIFARKYMKVDEEIKHKKLLTWSKELKFNPFINYESLIEKEVITSLEQLRRIKNIFRG